MVNIFFLIGNFILCLYYIYNSDYSIIAYIVFFQEIHLIPFNNIGYNAIGYIYYIIIAIIFLFRASKLKISTKRLSYLASNNFIWSIGLITFLIMVHTLLVGLKTDNAMILVTRYSTQVVPVILYLVMVLNGYNFPSKIEQISNGILIYGILLTVILLFTTDFVNISNYERGEIRDTIGMSPIAMTRIGCTMFITAVMIFLDNEKSRSNKVIIALFFSIILIIFGTSRGPVFAMLIALLFYFIVYKDSHLLIIKSLKFIIPVGLFFLLLLLINADVMEIYTQRLQGLENVEDMPRYLRLLYVYEFFLNEFNVFSLFFLIGSGPAGFDYFFNLSYAHNFVIELMFEYGFFGFLSAILFIGSSLYYSYKLIRVGIPNKYLFVPLILLYLLVASMFSGDLIGWRNLFFMSIILLHMYFYRKKFFKLDMKVIVRSKAVG